MMDADPDFNPNKIDHRIMTLEALDRTSSKLLQMNGIKMPKDGEPTDGNEDDSTGSSGMPNTNDSPSANDLARRNLDNLMGEQKTVVQRRNSE